MVEEQDANYPHYKTSLGKYEDGPFTVGSYTLYDSRNVKVEHHKSTWRTLGDFPYASRYISSYSTVTIDGELYIFGELNLNSFPALQNLFRK